MTGTAHDPSLTRRRTVDWQDPAAVRRSAQGLTGLEIMRGIRDGTLPPPPMARLIGIDCVVAEPGEIVMELDPLESMENTIGLMHGGVAAALLDTVMGCTLHTLLPGDKAPVTVDLAVTYLRPLTVDSGRLRASARVLNLGKRMAYVEGEVRDGAGTLAAHAVGNFSIVTAG